MGELTKYIGATLSNAMRQRRRKRRNAAVGTHAAVTNSARTNHTPLTTCALSAAGANLKVKSL